jgi:hypothetical protein
VRYQTAPLPVVHIDSTDKALGTRRDSVRALYEHMFVQTGDDFNRTCVRCGYRKPASDCAWQRKAHGQRDNYCRPCRADYKNEHYAANRELYIANAHPPPQAGLAAERAACLVEFFCERPCIDCGETDPLVLEFDHLGHKSFNIAKGLRTYSCRPCSTRSPSAR